LVSQRKRPFTATSRPCWLQTLSGVPVRLR
jgi:hypothetical protein